MVDNGNRETYFIEPGFEDHCADDPYEMSSPQNLRKHLKENSKVAV